MTRLALVAALALFAAAPAFAMGDCQRDHTSAQSTKLPPSSPPTAGS